MAPKQSACVFNLRSRSGRTAREYDAAHISTVAADLIEMVAQALAANTATPGTYPTAEDGHVLLTWEQVQYFLLEDVLADAGTAEAQAEELGFGAWKERDNGTEPTVTLDELLTSAYLPALGAPATAFTAMCSPETLQGLRFRRAEAGEGYAAKYDLDGFLTPTWGTVGSRVYWDMTTNDLVLDSAAPFSGDLLVMGPADVGESSSSGLSSSGGSAARSVDWANIKNKPDVALKSDLYPPEQYVLYGIAKDPADLPTQGRFIGETWKIRSTDVAWAWTGNGWVPLPPGTTYTYLGTDFLKEEITPEPEQLAAES